MGRRNRASRFPYSQQPRFVVEQIVVPAGPRILASLYPVRVLVGWLTEPDDIGYLGGEHRTRLSSDELWRFRQLIRDGNRALTALPKLVQGDIVSDLPSKFERHEVKWRGQPISQPYIAEGWDFKLIRLDNIVSLQPLVSLRKVDSMMSTIHPTDFEALATLALPIDRDSFLQVAKLGDYLVLRNGYHRANALLRSGVGTAPGLFRSVHRIDELGLPPGTFAPKILDRTRPPTLADFLKHPLSATIR